jgi:hypothetical protein
MIYVDHQTLSRIAEYIPNNDDESPDYRAFLNSVRHAVKALPVSHQRAITMYYFENRETDNIAADLQLDNTDVCKLLREGLNMLKYRLADLVKKRWPNRFTRIRPCPICSHPRRLDIERIIAAKQPTDSWGKVNRALKRDVGCAFNPPSVIISHIKYHLDY